MSLETSFAGRFALALLCLLVALESIAQTPVPPPNPNPPTQATPGGVRPRLENQQPPRLEPEVFVIPPVGDRGLAAEDGVRLQVREFRISVAAPLERKAGAAVRAQVDSLLVDKVALQPEGGYTLNELDTVAAAVTDVYHNAGLILAWAYLPVQEVQDGVVQINVLPGTLSGVSVEGNRHYTSQRLLGPFDALIGDPVQLNQLENAVLKVRDYPGLTPSAVLSPGLDVGSSALTLRVAEKPVSWSLTGDNYGTVSNGRYRAIGSLTWNNPLGIADRLKLDVLQTFDPADNTYGSIAYEAPIANSGWSTGFSAYTNAYQFDAAGQALGLDGSSSVGGAYVRKQFKRSRTLNISLDGALNLKRAAYDDLFAIGGEREDKLSVVTVGLDLDTVDQFAGLTGITAMRIWYDWGIDDFLGSMDSNGDCNSTRQGNVQIPGICPGPNDFRYAGGDFGKVGISLQRLQQVTEFNSLLLVAYYQYSDDLLVSLEQVSLGGPFNSRGYPVAQALVDKGGFATLEWTYDFAGRFPNSFGLSGGAAPSMWNWFLFVDYGGGRINEAFSSESETVDLSSWGGGLEMAWRMFTSSSLSFRLEVATPLGNTEPLTIDDKDPRVWGRLSFNY